MAGRPDERQRHDRRRDEWRVRPARRLVGVARRGAERQDEPRGADRRRVGVVLLDGALDGLAKAGNPPEKLETSATVTFQPGEGITKGALTVRGTVPGLDDDGVPRGGRGREGELPRLAGARRHPRRDARRLARVS